METSSSPSGPRSGYTLLRLGDRLLEVEDGRWEQWVRAGLVPPDAMVLSALWTKGVWRRAGSLEVYHLFRPAENAASPAAGSAAFGSADSTETPSWRGAGTASGPSSGGGRSGLPRTLFGPGLSVTQILLLINLVTSAALVFFWRDDFGRNLWEFSGKLHSLLVRGWAPVLFIPLFLHVSAGHLMGNMVGLAAAGVAVEEFYGPFRSLLLYLGAGLCGAGLSLLRVKEVSLGSSQVQVLSVGASGAIMGLYGVILVFLLRYRSRFPERQRWKTRRIYFPLLVLALLPSLFSADLYSHVGGFAGGALLALLVRPDDARLPRRGAELG